MLYNLNVSGRKMLYNLYLREVVSSNLVGDYFNLKSSIYQSQTKHLVVTLLVTSELSDVPTVKTTQTVKRTFYYLSTDVALKVLDLTFLKEVLYKTPEAQTLLFPSCL